MRSLADFAAATSNGDAERMRSPVFSIWMYQNVGLAENGE
jgi:hypothetical protein